MNIIHRRAKLDDLKEIISLLADDKLGSTRKQAGREVAQKYFDAKLKMKIIYSILIYLCITFACLNANAQDTYTLLEGEGAQKRLNIQNEFSRNILVKAFKEISLIADIKGMKVVDFGCGTSSAYPDIKAFMGSSGQYIGIDNSAKQIAFNKRNFENLHYVVGDEQTEAVKNVLSSADIIYIRFVVMHQKNPQKFLENIYSIIKPGAFIIIQEPESDQAKKKFITEKYPFATELCDFKILIGQKRGLDYNFAPKIQPYLQNFSPKKLIHSAEYNELPMPQAKHFLKKTLDEIHAKDSSVLNKELLNHYTSLISKLPENEDDKWRLDLMHTIIVQK